MSGITIIREDHRKRTLPSDTDGGRDRKQVRKVVVQAMGANEFYRVLRIYGQRYAVSTLCHG